MAKLNLPTAKRTVRRGIGVCRRMGYTEDHALQLIMACCLAAVDHFPGPIDVDATWLANVHEEARCQLAALRQRQQ